MTKTLEKWPVTLAHNDIIRGGLGLVTDKTKKKQEVLKNLKTAVFKLLRSQKH